MFVEENRFDNLIVSMMHGENCPSPLAPLFYLSYNFVITQLTASFAKIAATPVKMWQCVIDKLNILTYFES